MQTLIPQPAQATAAPLGRTGRWLGFGLTPLAWLLFAAGFLLAVPAFYHARRIGFMLGWDALLAAAVLFDRLWLPKPEAISVTRSFLDAPELARPTRVELSLLQDAHLVLDMRVVDDLHPALIEPPVVQRVELFPRDATSLIATVAPRLRGDFELGRVYLRYRSPLRLVERWAVALPVWTSDADGATHPQHVRVYPQQEDSRGAEFYLLRARQIELQRRKLQLRGQGREFESMREYQPGDELRKISWTATARRGHLVTRQFTVERSQQVWLVLDAGRLSRTAFELQRVPHQLYAETAAERDRAHIATVTQLDQATSAAIMLAQVIGSTGDKFAMMAYGRTVQQLLPPGAGPAHLRLLIDLLSQTRSEAAEADHLAAMARLKLAQQRRGLIVWLTELTDAAGRPEVATAAVDLARRHLVVLVLLRQPELEALAARRPATSAEMFHITAAQEMLERRRATIRQLEQQGVLIVEATAEEAGARAVSQYLEVKAQGRL
jgi:uncharacterized protein (DUF58 family)